MAEKKYRCHLCGKRFEDGQKYAEHIVEVHPNDRVIGISVEERVNTEDKFGG